MEGPSRFHFSKPLNLKIPSKASPADPSNTVYSRAFQGATAYTDRDKEAEHIAICCCCCCSFSTNCEHVFGHLSVCREVSPDFSHRKAMAGVLFLRKQRRTRGGEGRPGIAWLGAWSRSRGEEGKQAQQRAPPRWLSSPAQCRQRGGVQEVQGRIDSILYPHSTRLCLPPSPISSLLPAPSLPSHLSLSLSFFPSLALHPPPQLEQVTPGNLKSSNWVLIMSEWILEKKKTIYCISREMVSLWGN